MESCKLNKDDWPSILGSSTAEGDCNKKKVKVFYKIEHLFLTEQIQAQLPQLPPAARAGNALSLWVCTWCQFTQKLVFPFWSDTSGTGTADSDCAAPARASCFSWAASGKPQSSSCLNCLCIKVWMFILPQEQEASSSTKTFEKQLLRWVSLTLLIKKNALCNV